MLPHYKLFKKILSVYKKKPKVLLNRIKNFQLFYFKIIVRFLNKIRAYLVARCSMTLG